MGAPTQQTQTRLFTPAECDERPSDVLVDIGVERTTITSLDTADEVRIEDAWDGTRGDSRPLLCVWAGDAQLDIIRRVHLLPG